MLTQRLGVQQLADELIDSAIAPAPPTLAARY
jgi:hypothetical protein